MEEVYNVREREILVAGVRQDAWFICCNGKEISQPFPSKATAVREMYNLVLDPTGPIATQA